MDCSPKKPAYFFEAGQRAVITIGDAGDIISVQINGKVTPVQSEGSLTKFAKELAALIKRGQERFDKSAAKKLKNIKVNSSLRPAARSNKARIEEAEKELAQSKENEEQVKSQLAQINERIEARKSSIEDKNKALEAQKAEATAIRAELAKLGA